MNEVEDKEHFEIQMFGADAADWLKRWDEGKTVWSISMGGLGPVYEQCIQITTAEILRHLLVQQYDTKKWTEKTVWEYDRGQIEDDGLANPVIKELGLSDAQWGVALNLAVNLYMKGPRKLMAERRIKHRRIQVERCFPVPLGKLSTPAD